MFLRKHLIEALADQVFLEETFRPESVDQWSYSLRLGREAYLSPQRTPKLLNPGEMISIEPGEFALLTTLEKLRMPLDHVGFISLKFSHALKGLVNISGFHVDPGFEGHILFSVYNAGPNPVMLREGDEVFMILFFRLDGQAVKREEDANFKKISRLEAHHVGAVRGPSVSLIGLNRKVERLEGRVRFLYVILGAVGIAIASTLVTRAAGLIKF